MPSFKLLTLSALLLSLVACGKSEDPRDPQNFSVYNQKLGSMDLSLCRGETPAGLSLRSHVWYSTDTRSGVIEETHLSFFDGRLNVEKKCSREGVSIRASVESDVQISGGQFLPAESLVDRASFDNRGVKFSCRAQISATPSTFTFEGPCLKVVTSGEAQYFTKPIPQFLGAPAQRSSVL